MAFQIQLFHISAVAYADIYNSQSVEALKGNADGEAVDAEKLRNLIL